MLRVPFKMLLAPIPPFRLSRANTALLLMDFQRFTAARDSGLGHQAHLRGIACELDDYYAQVDQAIPKAQRLLAACRSHGILVLHTILNSRTPDGSDLGRFLRTTRLPIPTGSPEDEICPEVAPLPGEPVIPRTRLSPFRDTDLRRTLEKRGIDTLILSGLLANVTVALAAQEAADRDFGVIIVRDASASETTAWHLQTMNALIGGLIRVRSTQQVIEMLEGTRT